MAVFLVVSLEENAAVLDHSIHSQITNPRHRYPLSEGRGWLIRFLGTPAELSQVLGVSGQPAGVKSLIGKALIVEVSNYFGMGPMDMWEWIQVRSKEWA